MRMYDPLFTTLEMAEVFSFSSFVGWMLEFEIALAEALEQTGVIPAGCSDSIRKVDPDALDCDAIARGGRSAGNLCIPFVKILTEKVAEVDPVAAGYVHWGATSQDVIDSAMMLQMKAALPLLEADLNKTCDGLVKMIRANVDTVMSGRTWLQQGPPITLGLKVAGWLDALHRHKVRLARVRSESIALQFGGAVGTLAALGGEGIAVTEFLALKLGLPAPEMPWHTQRDRIVDIATTLGALVGTLGKMARDVSLLMQTEVGEFLEPAGEGRGGSSTMPHKRNPVASAVMLSAAMRVPGLVSTMLSAMVQEHERGVGGWHAEWETLTEIVRLTAGCLRCAEEIAEGAIVEVAAMQVDLDILRGVAMAEGVAFALARRAGKAQSHRIVEEISQRALREKISMKDAIAGEPSIQEHFTREELLLLLEPANYLGVHRMFIQRVLAKQTGGTHGAN